MSRPLFIANWKLYFDYNQSKNWCIDHAALLHEVASRSNATVVICPSFPVLETCFMHVANKSSLALGAQNCSAYESGAHTGQVSAVALAQVGCSYVIIGHSELQDSQHISAQKLHQALSAGLIPVICIAGGDSFQFDQQILEKQLSPYLAVLTLFSFKKIYFAYEPLWAIGSGSVPDPALMTKTFKTIEKYMHYYAPHHTYGLLYGGGITAQNVHILPKSLQGLLIGSASIDINQFSAIIKQWYTITNDI